MAEDKKDQASEAPVSQAPAKDSQASEATQSQAPAKDSQASDPTSGKAVVTPEIVAQVVKAIQSMVKPADQPAGEQIRD
ncbi:hypothetical protein GRC93_10275, partial [Streptococcus thermophilus]|nr:hypothetical protein [Streptococcus thermophilus]